MQDSENLRRFINSVVKVQKRRQEREKAKKSLGKQIEKVKTLAGKKGIKKESIARALKQLEKKLAEVVEKEKQAISKTEGLSSDLKSMEKKFRILRVIGTIWKVLAWIVLILGVIASFATLLMSIFGGGMMRQLLPPGERMPWSPLAFGAVGGIVGFLISLVLTLIYFLGLYAAGEFIYLLLAIEENTHLTAQWIQAQSVVQAAAAAPPAYPTPPPPQAPQP